MICSIPQRVICEKSYYSICVRNQYEQHRTALSRNIGHVSPNRIEIRKQGAQGTAQNAHIYLIIVWMVYVKEVMDNREDFQLVRVPADGSCMFHAIAATLAGRALSSHESAKVSGRLQDAAIGYVVRFWRSCIGGVRGNPTGREMVEIEYRSAEGEDAAKSVRGPMSYAKYMRRRNTYGGHTELLALSGLLGAVIIIHRSDVVGGRVLVHCNGFLVKRSNPAKYRIIHLAFDPQMQHYEGMQKI
jgi:hypothetical protein